MTKRIVAAMLVKTRDGTGPVSVTERTQEAGLRLAVGSRSRDILGQFFIEALTVSMAGH